ncbi:Flp pilus assembly protein CpaB [Vibrio cyclitrophicus]|uniref:Flp pilus assembly protein CpaB n=1 Tax=Vibrio cyclitrophicus TaxID=47951 RepID=UPI000C829919|nr:Flp pilus assembly protein CpaB [Vibrio cyclitrophicus]MBU2934096.1 Flp pilus assembly protein CpaB [Vibrio cyclitrophicus]PMF37759.1 Flp pilus assembly protein CpaB [Vibrio cyclitrophicus]
MKKNIILGMAVIAILFGLYGLAGSLSKQEHESTTIKEKEEVTVQVWTLLESVTKGQHVERSQLKLQRIPENEANTKGVVSDIDLDFVTGSVYRQNIIENSVVFPELIINPEQDGYVELVIAPNRVPYAIKTEAESVIGGIVTQGTLVDILSISTPDTLLVETSSNRKNSVSVTPIVMGVKVLQVNKQFIEASRTLPESTEIRLIVELTRNQVAKLTIAKHISSLEVHKSIGEYQKSDLQADAGDVLPGFKSIVEFRANQIVVN